MVSRKTGQIHPGVFVGANTAANESKD